VPEPRNMSTSISTGPPEGTPTTIQGATIAPAYAKRSVKYLAVSEHELSTFTLANTLSVFFMSAGSFFAGIAASIWIGVALVATSTSTTELLSHVVAPLAAVLAVLMFVGAVLLFRFRMNEIRRIRTESN
jgi:hypothetical protein